MTTNEKVSVPSSALRTASAEPKAPIGSLSALEPDLMTLHTRDALQLFIGRAADPDGKFGAIVGGRRFAAILHAMLALSANDNPYADWLLIRLYDRLEAIRSMLDAEADQHEATLTALRQRGMSLSVLAAPSPITVRLGFRSPYGYATAETILVFDRYVRLVRTLVTRDRLSESEGSKGIDDYRRSLRGLFLDPIRWERVLQREDLAMLGRRDFLPDADAAAQLRTQTVLSELGEIPPKVLTGDMVPRHTRGRSRLSPADVAVLREKLKVLALHPVADRGEGLQ
jgi:integrating conjugative element protein (TIGR03761 family)